MSESKSFDAIVIGGGHNGLVAAAYLAKANKRVCVLERRHILGGCSNTEEVFPGYKFSTAAYVISLFLPEIIRELKLKENGLDILPRNPSSFTPMLDGRSLLLGPDEKANHATISQFSRKDADAFPRYESLLESVAKHLEPVLAKTSPDPLPLPKSWRSRSMGKQLRDLKSMMGLHGAMKTLGDQLPEALELLTGAARPILERWFETEVLKATLATDAIIGAFASISAPGTAYVLLHHVMGEAGGARGVWGYIRGGMGGLADALEKSATDLGVEILRESPVKSINVNAGKVEGVTLVDGRTFAAPIVASTVDAHLTFEKMLSEKALPESYLSAIKRIDYSSASAKINLALSEPPQFECRETKGWGPEHNGTIHFTETMDSIERGYDDAKYGEPSKEPIVEMTIPSSVDSSLAPEGHCVASLFVQYAPYKLKEGLVWSEIKDDFADRCIDVIAKYAPNIKNAIVHRQVLSPVDLEETFGLTGGNIFQGAMNFNQLFMTRPLPGWADHRTPVRGLYLCGAASHPGGGVMGSCGRNGAREILRDF